MVYLQVHLHRIGYMKDSKDKYHFIVDEDAAKIVRKIFSMYASVQGAKKICLYLNENKIPIPSEYKHEKGSKYNCSRITYNKRIKYQVEKDDTLLTISNKYQSTVKDIMEYNSLKNKNLEEGQIIVIPIRNVWRTNTIYNMLRNEVYIGTLIQHKNEAISYKNRKLRRIPKEQRIVVPHCHEAIIDKDTWNLVNSKLGRNRKVKSNKDGEIHLFSGKLICDCCGHRLYRDASAKRKNKSCVYWRCGNRYSTVEFLCNNKKSIKEEEIYELILSEINKKLVTFYDKSLIKKYYDEKKISSSFQNEIEHLKKEKDKIEKDIVKKENTISLLYEDRTSGIIDLAEFIMIKNRNILELNNYKERLEKIDKEVLILSRRKTEELNVENILEKYNKIDKLNRNILDEFISQIYVGLYNSETGTRKIKIKWNFDDE